MAPPPPPNIPPTSYHDQWSSFPSFLSSSPPPPSALNYNEKIILKVGSDINIDNSMCNSIITLLLSLSGHSQPMGATRTSSPTTIFNSQPFSDGSIFLDLLQRVSPTFFPRSTIRNKRDPPYWKSNLQTIYLLLMEWGSVEYLQDWSCFLPLPDFNDAFQKDLRSLLSFCLISLFACWKIGGSLRVEMEFQSTKVIKDIMKYYEDESKKWPFTTTISSIRSPPSYSTTSPTLSNRSLTSPLRSPSSYYSNNFINSDKNNSKFVNDILNINTNHASTATTTPTTTTASTTTTTTILDLQSSLENLRLEKDKSESKYHELLQLIRGFGKRIGPFLNGYCEENIFEILKSIEEALSSGHSSHLQLINENKCLKEKIIPKLKKRSLKHHSKSKQLSMEKIKLSTHRSKLKKKLRKLWKRYHKENENSENLNQKSLIFEAKHNRLIAEVEEIEREKDVLEGKIALKDLLIKDYNHQLKDVPNFEEIETKFLFSKANEEMLKREIQEKEVEFEVLQRKSNILELLQADLLDQGAMIEVLQREKKILQRIIYENDKTQKQRSFSMKDDDDSIEVPPPIFYSNPTSPLIRES